MPKHDLRSSRLALRAFPKPIDSNHLWQRTFGKALLAALLASTLAACTAFPTPPVPTLTPPVVSSPSAPAPASPTPAETAARTLRLWLPPQFAPDVATPGGQILADQIIQFEQAQGQDVETRLKLASGPGGLLESLVTAYNVAPAILPDLVALSRDDLAAAAAAGLVIPLDNLIASETLDDYYPFAQAMGRHEDQIVGLPFAADARVLAYRTDLYSSPPPTWTAVTSGTLIIPGGEATGLTLLTEYLALGGPLADPSGETVLDAELLAEALTAFQALHASGPLPLSTLDYTDTLTTWQVFRERRATLAVVNAQSFLAEPERVSNSALALLPTSEGPPLALADGWCWALVNRAAPRHPDAVELLQWLVAPSRLATWTLAARVLPPRAKALEGWDVSIGDVLSHAQLQPPAEVLAVVGAPLQRALDDVLRGAATPFEAASAAAQAVAQSGR